MNKLTTYRAIDRRLYNGTPCPDLQRELDHTSRLEDMMHELDNSTRCAFFPSEGKHLIFWRGYQLLTGNLHLDKQEALIEAIKALRGKTMDQ